MGACLTNNQARPHLYNEGMVKKMAQKMGIMDVLAFAKAGYSPKDVKEIMAMADSAEEAAESVSKENTTPEQQKAPEQKPKEEADAPDYKAMFEEMQKKNEELNFKLEAAQKANVASDVSGNQTKVSTSETINNIFREVLN